MITYNDEQARAIARAILPDIKNYISLHQAEYEAFLQEELEHTQARGGDYNGKE